MPDVPLVSNPTLIGIELASDAKFFRTLARRNQHLVKVRHRAVVHEWRSSPHAVTRRRLVDPIGCRRLWQFPIAVQIRAARPAVNFSFATALSQNLALDT